MESRVVVTKTFCFPPKNLKSAICQLFLLQTSFNLIVFGRLKGWFFYSVRFTRNISIHSRTWASSLSITRDPKASDEGSCSRWDILPHKHFCGIMQGKVAFTQRVSGNVSSPKFRSFKSATLMLTIYKNYTFLQGPINTRVLFTSVKNWKRIFKFPKGGNEKAVNFSKDTSLTSHKSTVFFGV